MDEDAVDERSTSKFICHKCRLEFDNIRLNYTCPHCLTGFVEEVQVSGSPFHDLANMDFVGVRRHPSRGRNRRSLTRCRRHTSQLRRHRVRRIARGLERRITRIRRMDRGLTPMFENVINGTLNIAGRMTNWSLRGINQLLNVNNNLINFDIRGQNVFDDISTQLLNQTDGSGPPPMSIERIFAIPLVLVSNDQVKSKLQCSICWEYFKVGELVRSLPCQHLYHDACIRPWLELHATCPICRLILTEAAAEAITNNSTSNEISFALLQFDHIEQEQHGQLIQDLYQLNHLIYEIQQAIQNAYP